ncbi:MAG TPA: DUF1893 domain-containing protein [Spirochaetia bacterium]|nr:DUF1893 domain-containing protein [Spirochaetia bacterium]
MASDTTLEFSIDGQVLFTSAGKWLHPLFELERFLDGRQLDMSRAEIRDKIIGRASAFLIVRMGIRRVHAGVLSLLGKDVLDRAEAACTWDALVDTIQCRTEGLLRTTRDPQEAYRIVSDLAAKDRERQMKGPAVRPSASGGPAL